MILSSSIPQVYMGYRLPQFNNVTARGGEASMGVFAMVLER